MRERSIVNLRTPLEMDPSSRNRPLNLPLRTVPIPGEDTWSAARGDGSEYNTDSKPMVYPPPGRAKDIPEISRADSTRQSRFEHCHSRY